MSEFEDDPPTLEETITEDWVFKTLGSDEGVALVEPYSPVPDFPVKLFGVSNARNRFVAAGATQLAFGAISDLRSALKQGNEVPDDTIYVPHEGILLVEILANQAQVAVYDSAEILSVYALNGTRQWSIEVSGIIDIQARPGDNALAYLAEDKVYLISDLSTQKLGNATSFSWHRSGNKVAMLHERTVSVYKLDDSRAILESSLDLGSDISQAKIVRFVGDRLLIVEQAPGSNIVSDLWLTYDHGWFELMDIICPPVADPTRSLAWYLSDLSDWVPTEPALFVNLSSASSDVTLVTPEEVLTPAEDSGAAALPFTEDDTTPVGTAIDYSSSEEVMNPFLGMDSSPPMPILWVLNNEGHVIAWSIVSKEAVKTHAIYPQVPRVKGELEEPRDQASTSTASVDDSQIADESRTPIPLGLDSVKISGSSEGVGSVKGTPFMVKPDAKPVGKFSFNPERSPQLSQGSTAGSAEPPKSLSLIGKKSAFGDIQTSFKYSWSAKDTFGPGGSATAEPLESSFGTKPAEAKKDPSGPPLPSSSSSGSVGAFESSFEKLKSTGTGASPFASLGENATNALLPEKAVVAPGDETNMKKANESPFGKFNYGASGPKSPISGFVGTGQSSGFAKYSNSPFSTMPPRSNSFASTSAKDDAIPPHSGKEASKSIFRASAPDPGPPVAKSPPVDDANPSDFREYPFTATFTAPNQGHLELENPSDGIGDEEDETDANSISDEYGDDSDGGNVDVSHSNVSGFPDFENEDTVAIDGAPPLPANDEITSDIEQGVTTPVGPGGSVRSLSEDETELTARVKSLSEEEVSGDGSRDTTEPRTSALAEAGERARRVSEQEREDAGQLQRELRREEERRLELEHARAVAYAESEAREKAAADSRAEERRRVEAEADRKVGEKRKKEEAAKRHREYLITSAHPEQHEYSERGDIMPFEVPAGIPEGLGDLDMIYSEANALFRGVGANIGVVESLISGAIRNLDSKDPASADAIEGKESLYSKDQELRGLLTSLQTHRLRSRLEKSTDAISDSGERVEDYLKEYSPTAVSQRPLPLREARMRLSLRTNHATVIERLAEAEEARLLLQVQQSEPPSVANLKVSVDIVDQKISKLQRLVESQQDPAQELDSVTRRLDQLGFNDFALSEEIFLKRQESRQRVAQLGKILARQSADDIIVS